MLTMRNHTYQETLPKVHQAVDRLMHYSHADLFDLCQEAHKDQYGFRGRHLYDCSVAELVNWWLCHYEYDPATGIWNSITPFDK